MIKLKSYLPLIIIVIFSFFLYVYKLDKIPPSIYVDEATVGYNAYSLLQTGKDEFGQSYPLLFRFFGAYTPPLYVYLIVPFVKLFGLSAVSIRLLSVISGVFSVALFYFTLQLFIKKSFYLILSTLIYSLLPWTVFNSRLGYEVMLASTLFNLGAYFLLKNLATNRFQLLGLFFISLSTYTAHTQKYLVPIFLIFYFLIFKKLSLKNIIFLLITQIPNLILIATPAFWTKGSGLAGQSILPLVTKFVSQYLTYLSPKTLFFLSPDIDLQHQIPQISLFFWWLIIPLFIGLRQLSNSVTDSKYRFLLFWILISIVPASLSGDFISVQRALPLLFPLTLLIAVGLIHFNKIILIFLAIYSFILLIRSYYFLFPAQMSLAWNNGYSQLTDFVVANPQKKFIIDNTRNPRNYILLLYYLQYPASIYHLEIGNYIANNYYQAPPTASAYSFGNFEFRPINWQTDPCNFDYLVGDELSISTQQANDYQLHLTKTITTVANQTALKIFSSSRPVNLCRSIK